MKTSLFIFLSLILSLQANAIEIIECDVYSDEACVTQEDLGYCIYRVNILLDRQNKTADFSINTDENNPQNFTSFLKGVELENNHVMYLFIGAGHRDDYRAVFRAYGESWIGGVDFASEDAPRSLEVGMQCFPE